jgi:hypothetical protein
MNVKPASCSLTNGFRQHTRKGLRVLLQLKEDSQAQFILQLLGMLQPQFETQKASLLLHNRKDRQLRIEVPSH